MRQNYEGVHVPAGSSTPSLNQIQPCVEALKKANLALGNDGVTLTMALLESFEVEEAFWPDTHIRRTHTLREKPPTTVPMAPPNYVHVHVCVYIYIYIYTHIYIYMITIIIININNNIHIYIYIYIYVCGAPLEAPQPPPRPPGRQPLAGSTAAFFGYHYHYC